MVATELRIERPSCATAVTLPGLTRSQRLHGPTSRGRPSSQHASGPDPDTPSAGCAVLWASGDCTATVCLHSVILGPTFGRDPAAARLSTVWRSWRTV